MPPIYNPISDHGGLIGLADDDHPQYFLVADWRGNGVWATVGVMKAVDSRALATSGGSPTGLMSSKSIATFGYHR